MAVTQVRNAFVKLDLTGEINLLDRLVQDQQVGFAQQRAGKQHALKLAARQGLYRAIDETLYANFTQAGTQCFGRCWAR